MNFIKGVPKLNRDLSYKSLDLTPVEGYLLSRIDGVSSIEDIVSTSGLPYEQAIEIVKSLWEKKVFFIDDIESQTAGSEKKDNVTLTTEEKANIEKMLEVVKNGNYYEMLSVPFNVKPSEVKIRFFELSKIYHPDRYFKKDIGSYKEKLNTIFKSLSEAYEVLYDPNKKKWYDATLANIRHKMQNKRSSSSLTDENGRAFHIDDTVKIEKPEENVSKSSNKRDTVKADNVDARGIENLTIDQKIRNIKDKINKNMHESILQDIEALKSIKDPRIPLLMAEYYSKQNNLLIAKDYVQMAIEYDPKNIDAYTMLANIYMKFKLYRNALKVYEIIKSIQPDNNSINEMIDKIKSLIED